MSRETLELSVIVPFRSSARYARESLERLHGHLSGLGRSFEIIAVDDASEDGTCGELARAARRLDSIRILRCETRLSKGACLSEGMRVSRGEQIVFTDGDLAFPLEKIAVLLDTLKEADIAIASRRRPLAAFPPRLRAALSRCFSAFIRALLLPDIEDTQAGLKAMRRSAAQLIVARQRCAGFSFDVELLAIARRFGLKVRQVRTTYDDGGPSTVSPLRDGLRLLWDAGAIWGRLRADAYSRCGRQPWQDSAWELDLSDDAAVEAAGRPRASWTERAGRFIAENPAWLLVPLTSVLTFLWFLPEVVHCSLYMNDGVLHASIIRRMDWAWSNGGDIFDFWLKNISAGHAFIRVSHFLMYLTAFLIHKALLGKGSIELAFALTVLLTAVLMPWSLYFGGRLLGFSVAESAVAAVLLPMVRDTGGFGISLENFCFSGHGIYNEAFAMLSFPITLGLIHRAMKGEGRVVPAAVSYTITWMSHLFFGYMAALWMLIDAFLTAAGDRRRWAEPLGRALGINALFAVFGAGLIVPILQDRFLQMRSLDEPFYRFMGRGAEDVLQRLFTGAMFDNGKPYPAVTALAVGGMILGAFFLIRRRQRPVDNPTVLVAVQSAFWILLAFGRATWGGLLSLLPFSQDVHWHRFVGCAQLMMLYGAGAFFVWACRRLARDFPFRPWPVAALATAAFCPGLVVGSDYFLGINQRNLIATENAWKNDTEMHAILDFARKHHDFRIAPGDYRNFGKDICLLPGFPLFAVLNEFNVDTISMLYHSLSLTSPLNYGVNLSNRDDMQLVNVRWLVLPASMPPEPGLTPVLKGPKAVVYDNGNTEGFFMVGSRASARCADNDILFYSIRKWLNGSDQDNGIFPGVTLVDECHGNSLIDAVDTKSKPTASGRILAAGAQKFRGGLGYWAQARMDSPGLLVFKMEYHPSWQITLNGKPAKTYMVVPGYTAVRVDAPGLYRIEARYESSGERRWLLLFGAVSALLLGLWSWGRGGKREAAPRDPQAPDERRADAEAPSRRGGLWTAPADFIH